MNIEIMDVYPIGENPLNEAVFGTLRVKLVDFGIELLGVFFVKKIFPEVRWSFSLPMRVGIDHVTGKRIPYPTITFTDPKMQIALMDALFDQAPSYIEARMADAERPLIFPIQKPRPSEYARSLKQSKPPAATQKVKDAPLKTVNQEQAPLKDQEKLNETVASPAHKPAAKFKEFMTPPPRKPAFVRNKSKFCQK